MIQLIETLAQEPVLTLGALAVLILALLVVLVWQLKRSRLSVGSTPTADELPQDDGRLTYVDLRADSAATDGSLERALATMRRATPDGDLYRVPWFLFLGQTAAGKTTLLDRAGLPLPLGAPARSGGEPTDPSVPRAAALAWVFDAGVVLDVLGSLVLRPDGYSSDEEGWLDLLRALRRSRRRRPIDGVVLAIPADQLLVGTTAEARQAAAAAPAARLFSKLLTAELTLGMSFPVDVVITKSDLLSGFAELTQGLPKTTLGQMFGWSNPHPLDAPYQSAWVGEAYGAIDTRLQQILAASPTPPSAEAAAFPAALAATQPAAQVYLNHLFSAAGLGEPLALRGLYFCGGHFPAADAAAACCDGPEAVLFAHDVLADKLLPENALAQPTAAATRQRQQRARRLGWLSLLAALLGFVGLGWGYRSVKTQADALSPVVELLGTPAAGAQTGETGETWADELLTASQGLDSYQPRSLFLPSSWVAPLHARIRRAFDQGYEQKMMPVSHQALGRHVEVLKLPAPALPPLTSSDRLEKLTMPAVPDTPEFLSLSGFVSDVTDLETAAEDYSCLGVGCGGGRELVDRFNGMAKYLYGQGLSLPNRRTERFYAGVMESLSFAPWDYRQSDQAVLQAKTQNLTDGLFSRLFESNALLSSLDRLVADLARVETPFGATDAASVESYQRLDAEFKEVAWRLAQPQIQWMGAPTLDLGPEMDAVYAAIGASRYLGPSLEASLEAQAEREFLGLQARLLHYETKATGPVLARQNGRATLAFSPGTTEVQKAVTEYLSQTFIEPEATTRLKMPLDWQRLLWDPNLLGQALGLVAPYDTYVSKELVTFPPDMRATAQQVALESLDRSMLELIAKAEQMEVAPWSSTLEVPPQLLENDLRSRASNFETVSSTLQQILSAFLRLELIESYVELARVIERQELQLLVDNSHLLTLEDLYSPRSGGFGWWDGLSAPAPMAFGASDAKGLDAYLAQELAIASRLAGYAQPVLAMVAKEEAVLERDPALAAELDYWGLILTDLDQAKSQKAGNPVATLQSFISKDLSTVTLPTCFAEPMPGGESDSYFEQRQAALEEELRGRCTELAQTYGYACYRELASTFNQRLGGRFPFASFETLPAGAEAEPSALLDFYGLYDQYAWLLREAPPTATLYGDQALAVATFIAENAPVRSFLAPFLDNSKTYPVPQWGFTVEFRVNPAGEQGAEEVIGWTLTTAGKTYERGGTTNSGTWAYTGTAGPLTPTTMTLRWAENSPRVPVEIESRGLARLEGRSAIYQYNDPWSLIALLVDMRYVNPANGLEPETLRFKVRTAPAPSSSASGGASTESWFEANLFVRISLTSPDGKQPIDLPPVFPLTAPEVPPRFEMRVCPTFSTNGG